MKIPMFSNPFYKDKHRLRGISHRFNPKQSKSVADVSGSMLAIVDTEEGLIHNRKKAAIEA